MKKNLYLSLLFVLFCTSTLFATHNRAGEISIEALGQKRFRATIHTYTKASSIPADRDSLPICWGDGNCEWIIRANGTGILLPNDVKYNVYIAEHTYTSNGEFMISMTDPNRNGGILNVNPPASDNVQFHIETKILVFNPQFSPGNNTPVLLAPPIDIAFVGFPFQHSPNAFDIDGDSIAYELITPLQSTGSDVPNYLFPNEIQPGPQNNLTLNEFTGELRWDSPEQTGEYAVAIRIKEYRAGTLISTTVRDMQILVEIMQNIAPTINMTAPPAVISSGSTIDIDIQVTDADNAVRLSATGGPFELDIQPATFTASPDFENGPISANFRWQTSSDHQRNQPYQVVVKAEDELGGFELSIFQITVDQANPTAELLSLGQLQLYPNPATDRVWLKWSGTALEGSVRISLYNLQGSLVLDKEVDRLDAVNELDLSDLPTGAYMLTLSGEEIQLSQQLIKG